MFVLWYLGLMAFAVYAFAKSVQEEHIHQIEVRTWSVRAGDWVWVNDPPRHRSIRCQAISDGKHPHPGHFIAVYDDEFVMLETKNILHHYRTGGHRATAA